MKNIICPLTGTNDVSFEKKISVDYLKKIYNEYFQIDVTNIFHGIDQVTLYKCNKSGYKFYYPLSISGDNNFYNKIGELPWYYSDWKWEHEQSLNYIKPGMNVLEVGAAKGSFLIRLKGKINLNNVVGLELNSKAIEDGQKNNIFILNETIENHSSKHTEQYDIVCSYQVLEHISEVNSFLKAKCNALKKDGLLIISVPNNDSFLKDLDSNTSVLNMPPHHMGLWNNESLSYLTKLYNLEVVDVLIEPLQESNFDNYQYVKVKKMFFGSNLLVRIYWKLNIHKIFRPLIRKLSKNIIGHSIMFIYRKK